MTNKMKQFCLLLFALIMLPVTANAEEVEIDGVYYNLLSNNVAEVTKNPNIYTGEIVIPATITVAGVEYSVEIIGDAAFMNSTITSVKIPSTVVKIGNSAFSFCKSLQTINIPNSVSIIDSQAFSICNNLRTITLPNKLKSINFRLFYGSGIESVELPESLELIDAGAFTGCKYLNRISIPNTVSTISTGAFQDCSSLVSVSLPNTIEFISDDCFRGCKGLENITFPDGLLKIGNNSFYQCEKIKCVILPNTLNTIGSSAFNNCLGLKYLSLPSSIVTIQSSAFMHCEIDTVYCYAEQPPFTGWASFEETCVANSLLFVPKNSIELYESAEPWNSFGKIIGIDMDTKIGIIKTAKEIIHIYDIQGNRLDNFRKGVNIIRTKDGKTKKVVVK